MSKSILFSIVLLASLLQGCDTEFTPEPETPDAGRVCELAPDWSATITEAYSCGWDWTADSCPVCLVYLEEGDWEPLAVPGGLCVQVPACDKFLDEIFGQPDGGVQ